MAKGIRKDGDVRSPFSTSLMKAFERLATSRLGWEYAVANMLDRFTDQEDRESIAQLLDLREEKIKTELGLMKAPKKIEIEDEPEEPSNSREWRELMSVWA